MTRSFFTTVVGTFHRAVDARFDVEVHAEQIVDLRDAEAPSTLGVDLADAMAPW